MEALAFSPDGRWLAAGGPGKNRLRVWEMASAQQVCASDSRMSAGSGGVAALAFHPDGRRLLALTYQKEEISGRGCGWTSSGVLHQGSSLWRQGHGGWENRWR
ncbi:WD40 repeat domain-containing protein [Thermoflexus hugenholtzii]